MKEIPSLEFYNRLCPRRVRGWTVVPRIYTGACNRAAFPDWTRDDHFAAAMFHKRKADATRKAWDAAIKRGQSRHGDCTSWISGGFCEHWPRQTKDVVRRLARATSGYASAHELHWVASGKRMRGWPKDLGGNRR